MMSRWTCSGPFLRQCIVTTGASVNMAGTTLIMAYSSGLALQLRKPDTEIVINKSTESWIAAAPAIAGLLGSSLMAVSMAYFGRWVSQIASIVAMLLGWCSIIFAKDVSILLVGRFFHGLAMGSGIILTPILVGEWTSPKNRGAFMVLPGVLSGSYTLLAHTSALYYHWRTNAIVYAAIALANLPVAIYSPESPSWLATKQRYEDCRRAFRWLRGGSEEEELQKMIEASELTHKLKLENVNSKSDVSVKKKMMEFKNVMIKKDFYKPVLVALHVYVSGQCASSHIYNNYIFDLIESVVGKGYNEHAMWLNLHRLLAAILIVYLISKAKRKAMFLAFSGANALIMILISVYVYAKSLFVSLDSPIVGLILLHLLIFFVTTGTLPLPYVIAGEIFPLKYKSLCSGISILIVFINTALYVKTYPYLVSTIGLYGTLTMYTCIVVYCLVISYIYLPETKDRTLQEIEEELVGKPVTEDLKSVQSLLDEKPVGS